MSARIGGSWGHIYMDEPMGVNVKLEEGNFDMAPNSAYVLVGSSLQRRMRVVPLIIQLSQDSSSILDDYESEEDDANTVVVGNDDPR